MRSWTCLGSHLCKTCQDRDTIQDQGSQFSREELIFGVLGFSIRHEHLATRLLNCLGAKLVDFPQLSGF